MKKAPLALLLSMCLILALMVVALFGNSEPANLCGKNVMWTYDQDTCTLTISGTGPMLDYPHSTHEQRTHPWAEHDQEIRAIIVEEGVTHLGLCAFCTCSSLTEVTLPSTLISIGENAFWSCPQLSSVTIPQNVTTIAENAFKRCTSLSFITFLGDAPTEVASTAFLDIVANAYYPAQNSTWTSDTMIGHGGTLLYQGYDDPSNIHYLTDRGTCGPQTTWTMQDGILTVSGSGEMEYASWSHLKDQIRSAVVEEGVTTIAPNAFTYCSQLTEVRLPFTLQTIHKNAFALIPTLTQIQIPDTVTTIEGGAFAGCTALTSVELPICLETIPQRIFYSCTALKELTIPASVTLIESQAFGACTTLEKITFLGQGPALENISVFDQCTATVAYPADQLYWSTLLDGLADTSVDLEPYCSGIHSENNGTVAEAPSCSAFGRIDCLCPVCGLEYSIEIDPVKHDFSEGQCTICGYARPLPPTITSCVWSGDGSIRLSWVPVEGVDGYELLRADVLEPTADDWKCAKTIDNGTVGTYNNHSLTPGTVYSYKMRSFSYSASGDRILSECSDAIQAFGTISFTHYTSNQPDSVRLRWTPVEGASGYQIWRLEESGKYEIVKTIGDTGKELTNDQGDATAYTNDGLVSGKSYTYIIRAFRIYNSDHKVFGAFSEPVTVTVMS